MTFSSLSIRNNKPVSKPAVGGCSGASQHRADPTAADGPQTASSRTRRRGKRPNASHRWQRFLLNISSISAACAWQAIAGTGQPPRSQPQHRARRSPGCTQLLRERSGLSPAPLGSRRGLSPGLKSVLLLWSGRARDSSSSLLLSDGSAAGGGSPCVKRGWHCSLALQFMLF